MLMDLCDAAAKIDDSLTDRFFERISGGGMRLNITQDAFDALSPGVVLGPQVRQFLPDANFVRLGRGQGRLAQDVERNIWELVHVSNCTLVPWRFRCE